MPTVDKRSVEAGARERLLGVAYDLFARRGVRAVGVDELIERAGVAKATFYRHFRTKDDLVLAFLERREQRWTLQFVEAEAIRRGSTADERLLAIFDVFDEWFQRDDFEACSFINILVEMGGDHALGRASIRYLENIRSIVQRLAVDAAIPDPVEFAHAWHILMKGSIVAAIEGDKKAAARAKAMARSLIQEHRS